MYEIKRLPAIGHGGGLNGWSSDLLRLPEQHCTVVVLTNALALPAEAYPRAPFHTPGGKVTLADEIKKLPPAERRQDHRSENLRGLRRPLRLPRPRS